VESYEEFRRAREWGYRYFQGYFFARPTITGGKRPPAFKLNYERLLVQVYRPDVDLDRVALIIKQELSLSYALLRYVNSASFGWARRIESIQHALLLLGEQELRKWATLAIVSAACTGKPSELVVLSMVRARFCENLAKAARLPSSSEPFMTGLLSLLDAIVDTPLEEVLRTLTPSARMKSVLLSPLDETEPLSAVYHTVRAYEHADWPAVTGLSGRLGVSEAEVAQAYGEAVAWADGIFNAVRDRAA
jgi:EAL and modified HD-GYP domain-containing signal transduction protein